MVGVVLVSHSRALAEALADYVKMMAPDAPVACAGGLEDGSFGTSYEAIEGAIEKVNGTDGAVVLVDMGSAALTAKMVLEDLDDPAVRLADCPFVEGAVEATVRAQAGAHLDEITAALAEVSGKRKLA